MIYWVKYNRETGDIVMAGHSVTRGEMRLQEERHRDLAVVEADGPTMLNGEPGKATYIEAVRLPLIAAIDEAAEVRLQALMPTAARAMVYFAKEDEARSGATTSPFLDAEAEATGVPRKDLVKAVIAKAEAFRAAAVAIEAKRQAAKKAVRDADTIPAIIAAGEVDWGD
ncbi:hypothetical protein GG804_12890 [Sphingomonas histidinilytica]|uniref:hypothetical protein n=1 Tax=Rhizorhabdus histidinilytica TaxID=439228 RepID=UPI00063FD1F6|nr:MULTISPECIES: hypothetical protein [Sphingomonadaceae]MBO9377666.1 hypothetical protein [Rhizorhabdus histidinilytica]